MLSGTRSVILILLFSISDCQIPGIWAGGEFTSGQFPQLNSVGFWNESNWSPLASGCSGVGGSAIVREMIIFGGEVSSQYLFVIGDFVYAGAEASSGIAVWDQVEGGWDGVVAAFTAYDGGFWSLHSIAYDPSDDLLVVGGCFGSVDGVVANNVVFFNYNNATFFPLGNVSVNGVNGCVESILVLPDTQSLSLYAAGMFTGAAGIPAANIASYSNGEWSPLGTGITSGVIGHAHVTTLAYDEVSGLLYVGGHFGYAGGVDVYNVAAWTGDSWLALGGGVVGTVYGLALDGAGTLFAVGEFLVPSSYLEPNAAYFNASNTSDWIAMGGLTAGLSKANGTAVTVGLDGNIYVGGSFTSAGNIEAQNVAVYSAGRFFAMGEGIHNAYLHSGVTAVLSLVAGEYIHANPNTPAPTTSPDFASTYWWVFVIVGVCAVVLGVWAFTTYFRFRKVRLGQSLDLEQAFLIDGDHGEGFQVPDQWRIDMSAIQMLGCIGHGGGGTVYKASWKKTMTAVKMFHQNQDMDGFLSEFQLLSRLHHPNIVRLFGIVELGGIQKRLALVMEYLEGGNLSQRLHGDHPSSGSSSASVNISINVERAAVEPLTLADVVDFATGIASGMEHLHDHRPPILHRDLKPSNVLIGEGRIVKLADFGFSREKSDNETMTFCGTPKWSAPEVLRGERYDESADVWSFGVILWEMLVGEEPFAGLGAMKVVLEVSTGKTSLPIPSEGHPTLLAIIRSCLQFDPQHRPSFKQIVLQLEAITDI